MGIIVTVKNTSFVMGVREGGGGGGVGEKNGLQTTPIKMCFEALRRFDCQGINKLHTCSPSKVLLI